MKSAEDRRAQNVQRVPLTTLVDICTQEGEVTPFQAESANLSGRGMQVRTSYLPEVGEALICRLSHKDQEILVEGKVAWRSEGEDSGEFGVQFTALDADSAHLLKDLGQDDSEREPMTLTLEEEPTDEELAFGEQGSRVRLHIEGLGAPMKACVHEGSHRKLRVGSSLEFLKVGRTLQVEDVGMGETRGAHVDSVNVVINPSTSVPELVVQLRYEGMTPTPAPVKVKPGSVDYEDSAFAGAEADSEEHELDDEDPAPWEPAAEAFRARLGVAMKSAGQAASRASGMLNSVAKTARTQVAQAAASKNISLGKVSLSSMGLGTSNGASQPNSQGKRRQTTRRTRPAPAHLRSGIHDIGLASSAPRSRRPQAERKAVASQGPIQTKKKAPAAAIFGAAFLIFAGSAYGLRSRGEDAVDTQVEQSAQALPAAAAPTTAGEVKAPSGAQAGLTSPPAPEKEEGGVMAEVPLFGPQAMAVAKQEVPSETISDAEAEQRSAAAAVADESWDEAPAPSETTEQPWGRGKLYLPTVHRVRLDGVGAGLSGAINADGFTVVIPGRKAMESGKPIEKRDRRIVAVKTNNNAQGATVKFEFRGPVPPYRVRLRQDFVEFLISAPEDTVARL